MLPIKQPVNQPTCITGRRSTIEPSNWSLVSSAQAPSPITYRPSPITYRPSPIGLNAVRQLICARTQADLIDDADQSNWHISKHTFYLQLLRTRTYIIRAASSRVTSRQGQGHQLVRLWFAGIAASSVSVSRLAGGKYPFKHCTINL